MRKNPRWWNREICRSGKNTSVSFWWNQWFCRKSQDSQPCKGKFPFCACHVSGCGIKTHWRHAAVHLWWNHWEICGDEYSASVSGCWCYNWDKVRKPSKINGFALLGLSFLCPKGKNGITAFQVFVRVVGLLGLVVWLLLSSNLRSIDFMGLSEVFRKVLFSMFGGIGKLW